MTTADTVWTTDGDGIDVYRPQADSRMLIQTMRDTVNPRGRRVADLCSGSGIVAIAAAHAGAESVLAVDICPRAVTSIRANASVAGASVHALRGSWSRALEFAPFDLVVCNPPYVPGSPHNVRTPSAAGPALAYDGGPRGRLVLDPLCTNAFKLLNAEGTMLLVQSEFADPGRTVSLLSKSGLKASIATTQTIDFGPVLLDRADWMERTGLLQKGVRVEKLFVIRADKK